MSGEYDVQTKLTAEFRRQGARIAAMLQAAAVDVTRHVGEIRDSLHDLQPDHQAAATETIRDVQRLLANLPLDALLHAASEADRFARSSAHSIEETNP